MEDFSVKVPGTDFTLRSNTTYRIEGRIDSEAPIEFQREGFSKIPHPLNYEDAKITFDPNLLIWDTGLYEDSPCYSNVNKEEVKKTVETLKKYLVPSLEKQLPAGSLDYNSEGYNEKGFPKIQYFDNYKYPINQKTNVTTNTPKDFFGVWAALLSKTVAPEEEQKKPAYRNLRTPFIIIDRKEKASTKQKHEFEKANAQKNLLLLAMSENKKDVDFVIDVLDYVGLKGVNKTEPSIMVSQFNQWINNKTESLQNAKKFNKEVVRLATDEGREELYIYKQIRKALRESKITETRGEYFLKGKSIGRELKQAAKTVNESDNLKQLLSEILE